MRYDSTELLASETWMQDLDRTILSDRVEDLMLELADEPHPRLTKRERDKIQKQRRALPLPSRVPNEFYSEQLLELINEELKFDLDPWKHDLDTLEFWTCVRANAAECARRHHLQSCYCVSALDELEKRLDYRPATKTTFGARPLSVQDAYIGEVWHFVLNLLVPRRMCGAACGNYAARGAQFCAQHNASLQIASKVRLVDDARDRTRQALEQLSKLVPVAIETIADVMANGDRDADRLRAAETVLDRGGVPKTAQLDVSLGVPDDEIDRLIGKIQMAAMAKALSDASEPLIIDLIEVGADEDEEDL